METTYQDYESMNITDKLFHDGITMTLTKEEYSINDLNTILYFLGQLQITVKHLECALRQKQKELATSAHDDCLCSHL